jgi:D-3-phosphoglycerate dehydrogenase
MDKCKVISRYGIGVDNVDLEAATAKNIPVCNVPDYCINEVADHTLSLMLSLLRKIIPLFNSVKNRSSSPGKAVKTIYNLKKLTLGFVGLGKIPQNLYEKVKPIFNNIIVYDPYIKEDVIKKYNFNQVSFINLLKTSDIISIHCPFVDETYHLFSDSQFQLMKHTSYIVNTARGPIIDTSSLYQAIINRQIAGAALDVWEEESIGMVYDLAKLDNVIITPHVAYYSESSQKDVKYKAALNVIRILSGEKPKHVVNK